MVDLGGPNFVTASRAILGKAKIAGIRFTDLAARLLAETVRCLKYKNEHIDELSSTSYVLTTYRYLQATVDKSEELDNLRTAVASSGLSEADFEEMSQGFFSMRPTMPAETPDEYDPDGSLNVTLGPGFRNVLSDWKSDGPLSADALFRIPERTHHLGRV